VGQRAETGEGTSAPLCYLFWCWRFSDRLSELADENSLESRLPIFFPLRETNALRGGQVFLGVVNGVPVRYRVGRGDQFMEHRLGLLLVRNLYQDAERLASEHDPLSLVKAVLLLDLAVEQALGLVALEFRVPTGGPEPNWGQLWRTADKGLNREGNESLPHEAELSNLHRLRNQVQHAGLVPPEGEARRYLTPASAMLRVVFRSVFSLDFDSFRPWDLLGVPWMPRYFGDCEEAIEEGFALGAVAGCVVAHDRIMAAMHPWWHRGRVSADVEVLKSVRSDSDPSVQRLATAVYDAFQSLERDHAEMFNQIEERALALSLGLPALDTLAFLHAKRRISVEHGDRWFVETSYGDPGDLTPVARKMLDYLWRLLWVIHQTKANVLRAVSPTPPLKEQKTYLDWKKAQESK
jgi:hypothetical protein